ncbi:MAG: hypothetical protein AB1404_12985 [Spirochaetota bacterium]
MQTEISGPFIFHHLSEQKSTLEALAQALYSAEKTASEFFETDFDVTDIYVYPDHSMFKTRKYGLIGSFLSLDWYIGDNIGAKVLILSPDHPTKVHDITSIVGAIGHEYVHTVIYRLYPRCTLWLNEGMALYLTNGRRGADIHQSMEFPPEKILTSGNPLYFANHNGYSFADTFIQYLIDTYGKEALLALLREGNYDKALGLSRSQVYQDWKAWVQGRFNG